MAAMEAGEVLVRRPGSLRQQVTCCCCDEGQGLTRCRDGPQVEAEEAEEVVKVNLCLLNV